jgi:hypothetical protein
MSYKKSEILRRVHCERCRHRFCSRTIVESSETQDCIVVKCHNCRTFNALSFYKKDRTYKLLDPVLKFMACIEFQVDCSLRVPTKYHVHKEVTST